MTPLHRNGPADAYAMAVGGMAAVPDLPVEQKLVLYGAAATGREPDDEVRVAVDEAAEEAAG